MNRQARILVVDDEPDIGELVSDILHDEGYAVRIAENAHQARQLFSQLQPDVVLLDIWMPGIDGITLLKEWMAEGHDTRVIMMSGHGTVETAVEATREGAFDYIEKPLTMGKLLLTVKKALGSEETPETHPELPDNLRPVGRSQVLQELTDRVQRLASHSKHILVRGEPGSGRQFWSTVLHAFSPRKQQPLVRADAHWLQQQGWREQLFGTGGSRDHHGGLLEKSGGSSLLITNIQLLDQNARNQLLQIMERGRYPAGSGEQLVAINCRLIFTEDISAISLASDKPCDDWLDPLIIPALREHNSDVPDFVSFFVDQLVQKEQLPFKRFSVAALNQLRYQPWPGNLTELRNTVRQLLLTVEQDLIEANHVERVMANFQALREQCDLQHLFGMSLRDARDQFEKAYLLHHLEEASGNVSQVAKRAGMERTHLYRKMRNLGINIKHEKANK